MGKSEAAQSAKEQTEVWQTPPKTTRPANGGDWPERRGSGVILAAIFAAFVVGCGGGGDGDDDSDRTLSGITHATATFVTVGAQGRILTSSNGSSFIEGTSGVTDALYDVAFGADGVFVVVGDGGLILTSTDATTWSRESIETSVSLQGVAFGNGTFVVVGYGGTIATSADGHAWALRESGSEKALRGVVFGESLFVAVGDGGSVLTSTDATVWSEQSSGTGNTLYSVGYGEGVYLLAGNGTVGHSTDGVSWVTRAEPGLFILDTTFAQGQFVLVGLGGTILTSTDGGLSLTPRESTTDLGLRGVEFGGDKYVAVGSAGVVRVSADAATWSAR